MTSSRIFSYKENGGGEALQWGLERHGSFSRPQFAFVNGPLKQPEEKHWLLGIGRRMALARTAWAVRGCRAHVLGQERPVGS
jgi:hypothetical protein